MNIEDILKELGGQMGLPNLKLDSNKVCRLIFDKKYTVDIEASEDLKTVHIYSALCIIPPEGREKLYEVLLEANLFGRGTGGAAFGLDLELGEILLSRTLIMEKTDYQDFVNILESFVNHVEAWTDKIDKGDLSKHHKDEEKQDHSSSSSRRDDDQGHDPSGYIMA